MQVSRQWFVLAVAALVFVTISAAQQKPDAKGCKDSPLITRFPGSVIETCEDKSDDVAQILMQGPPKKIEGEVHRLKYNFPSTASKAQVVRNMNTALHNAGFIFDYDSGDYGDFSAHSGKTWITIEISGGGWYRETIVTETKLTQDVTADAKAMSGGLAQSGHAVVPGILFDTGKSSLKAESDASLKQVAKLLQDDPKLKVYVVGHTDNVGVLASNMELSKQRAAAVVEALSTKYGITASRLAPYGDGPYAPIASNDSEDGRSLNRRVELVKQ